MAEKHFSNVRAVPASIVAGTTMLVFVGLQSVLAAYDFAFGSGLSGTGVVNAFWFSGALLTALLLRRAPGSWVVPLTGLAAIGAALLVVHLSYFAASRYHDFSYDGQWYHTDTTLSLINGWNPFKHPRHPSVWSECYPRLTHIFSANAYGTYGNIEAGKACNIVLALSGLCLSFAAIRYTLRVRHVWSVLLAVALVCNPVVVAQLHSSYVDGALYSAVVISVSIAAIAMRTGFCRFVVGPLALSLIVLVGIKTTGVLYATTLVFLAAAIIRCRHRVCIAGSLFVPFVRKFGIMASILVGLTIGMFVVNYSPYVTNQRLHGSPFYPAETNRDWIIGGERPDNYRDAGAVFKIAHSLLADPMFKKGPARLGAWYSPLEGDLESYEYENPRTRGFGPISPWLFLFSMVALIAAAVRFRKLSGRQRVLVLIMVIAFGSAVALGEGWWARLAPQLWFMPVLACIACVIDRVAVVRYLGILSLGVILVNVAYVGFVRYAAVERWERELNSVLTMLSEAGRRSGRVVIHTGPDGGMKRPLLWLRERRIPTVAVSWQRIVEFRGYSKREAAGIPVTWFFPRSICLVVVDESTLRKKIPAKSGQRQLGK